MPNISSLQTPLSALRAHQRILEATANNVANASTPGYRRQRVETVTTSGEAVNIGGVITATKTGVDSTQLTRTADELLIARATTEEANLSSAQTASTTLSRIEAIFPEPSDFGLAGQLDALWSSWSELSTDPASQSLRSDVLAKASAVTATLRRSAADLGAIASGTHQQLRVLADRVNGLTAELADYNRRVASQPTVPPSMLDERDRLVNQLTTLTGAVVRVTGDNTVAVTIGGHQVVQGLHHERVEAPSGALRLERSGQVMLPTSGEAAAMVSTINDIVPRYLSALDDVAASLVSTVNALHTAGYGQDGVSGRMFFDPAGVTATTIALSADVAGQPARLAAGAPVLPGPVAPGPLDGNQARLLAALADSATGPDSRYQQMISNLAVETRAAKQRSDVQRTVVENAIRDVNAVSSVSIDEEMSQMIESQRAYQAAGKVLSTIDEMLGYLIERVG
jgi:flagellar hook-associated protein 1 FlgK